MDPEVINKIFPIYRTFQIQRRFADCDFCFTKNIPCFFAFSGRANKPEKDICEICIKEFGKVISDTKKK